MTKAATVSVAARSVIVERVLPHPPEKIWRALTQGPLIAEWLMQNDFEPVVGRKFNFRAPAMPHWNGVTDCEVIIVEPHKRLAYSWNSSGDRPQDHRHLDADRGSRRHPVAHGAIGLPARPGIQLSGRGLWLAAQYGCG